MTRTGCGVPLKFVEPAASELVERSKGQRGEYEGRGDLGVRFDKLNELGAGLLSFRGPEPVERRPKAQRSPGEGGGRTA